MQSVHSEHPAKRSFESMRDDIRIRPRSGVCGRPGLVRLRTTMSRVRSGVNTRPMPRAVRTAKRRAAAAMAAIDAGSKISTTVVAATDFVRSLIEIRLFEAVSFECALAETVLV